LEKLQEAGFPAIDPILERIDREAIDDWSNRRNGLISNTASEAIATTAPHPSQLGEQVDPWVKAARIRG